MMTKRLITLLIFIFLHTSAQSQTWKRVGSRGNELSGIHWVSDEIGFISGNELILKTIDGGLSWVEQEAPTKTRMWSVDFFDQNLGLMVGNAGEVFRTNDGGSTWQSLKIATEKNLKSVKFLNQTRAYIVGDAGEIYRSTNGGQTWAKQSGGTTADINGLFFANQDTGYAATSDGKIIRTLNSGNNWTIQNTGQSKSLNDIYFSSSKVGYVVGQAGTILKTSDAGSTWTLATSGTERNLNTISFNRSNPNIGVILGEEGTVLRTTNAGITFDGINLNNTQSYLGVNFRRTSNFVFAVGTNGTIISSTNSGLSWSVRQTGLDIDYKAVQFRTDLLGYIIGDSGLFLLTNNGGTTLTNRSRPVSGAFHGIAFTTNAFGYIAGDNGVALRTSNSGSNWTSLNPPANGAIYGLNFSTNANGYAVGENGFMGRTQNSGVSWTKISVAGTTLALREIAFFEPSVGIVIGQNGFLAKTSDGLEWQKMSIPSTEDLTDIDMLDANAAVVVGKNGTVLKTTNKGISWSKIIISQTKNLSAVEFLDESIGFIAGEKGLMMTTKDGGDTWAVMPTATFQDFTGISFGDLSSGFAVGENGSLFNYSCQVPETPTVIFGEDNICLSQQVYQVQNNDADAAFEWRVDGGTILEGEGTSRIVVRWDSPGRNAVLVRGTNSCGNGGTKGLEVLVSTTPQAIIEIKGDGVGCLEGFIEYEINDVIGSLFIWEVTGGLVTEGQGTSKIKVQWTKAGPQVVKVKPTNPCGEGIFFSKNIQIITAPNPTSQITGPERVGLTEEVYEVTNVPEVNFQWSVSQNAGKILSGQGTNKIRVKWEKQGDFIVSVVPMNSCNTGEGSSLEINVNFITSVGREPLSGKTNVYPNPSLGDVWVAFEGIQSVSYVRVSDVMGKAIYETVPETGSESVIFKGLQNGLYIVAIRTRDKEYIHKLVVK